MSAHRPLFLPLFACLLALLASSAFAADRHAARSLAATCANCHGTNGQALAGTVIAPLAGLPEDVMLRKLDDFRSGRQPASIMHQIAKGYSDEQLALIAAYFAAQKQGMR